MVERLEVESKLGGAERSFGVLDALDSRAFVLLSASGVVAWLEKDTEAWSGVDFVPSW